MRPISLVDSSETSKTIGQAADQATLLQESVEEGKKRALRKKLPDIIRACKKLSREKLSATIASAWDNFARYLKRYIDQAPDSDECFAYMVAADEINSKRDAVLAQFEKEFTHNFNEVLRAVIKRNQQHGLSTDGLSLMDNNELEESLATTKIVLFLQERFVYELEIIERRLQYLFGNYKLNSAKAMFAVKQAARFDESERVQRLCETCQGLPPAG